MVDVATSTSTPSSAQRRKSACVRAAYWFCRIGWTAARRRDRPGNPAARIASSAFSLGRCGWRRPGSWPRIPGGMTPVAGRAKRPSAPQTKSWVRATSGERDRAGPRSSRPDCRGETRRSRCSSSASRRGRARRRGSRRTASRSWGRRSRARSSWSRAEALGDRGRRQRRPELDRGPGARPATSSARGCARGRRGRACGRRRGTGRCRSTALGPCGPAAAIAVRPSVRSDGRIGSGFGSAGSRIWPSPTTSMPDDVGGAAVEELGHAARRRERRPASRRGTGGSTARART